jgi:hypothetical protein
MSASMIWAREPAQLTGKQAERRPVSCRRVVHLLVNAHVDPPVDAEGLILPVGDRALVLVLRARLALLSP